MATLDHMSTLDHMAALDQALELDRTAELGCTAEEDIALLIGSALDHTIVDPGFPPEDIAGDREDDHEAAMELELGVERMGEGEFITMLLLTTEEDEHCPYIGMHPDPQKSGPVPHTP